MNSAANRCAILLVCNFLQKNIDIINFLSCNKFMFGLRYSVIYYQQQLVTNKTNINILSRLTNIEYEIKKNRFAKIFYRIIKKQSINDILCNSRYLKKIIITGSVLTFINNFDCTKPLSSSTKHFGLYLEGTHNLVIEKDVRDFITIRNIHKFVNIDSTCDFVALANIINKKLINKIATIIPKNIKCFESDGCEFYDGLNNCHCLKKIIIDTNMKSYRKPNVSFFTEQIKKLPSSVTSISYLSNGEDGTYAFMLSIYSCTNIVTMHIDHCTRLMFDCIPPSIKKLKMEKIETDAVIPNFIQELSVKKIIYNYKEFLAIGPNIIKLTIRYEDRRRINPNIHSTCTIIYKG